MLKIISVACILLISSCQKSLSQKDIKIINFSSYSFSVDKRDPDIDIRNDILIIYLDDCIIYKTKITSIEELQEDSKFESNLNDTTYFYYFINKAKEEGLVYDDQGKWKTFNHKLFLKSNGLDFFNYDFFKLDLGPPSKIEEDNLQQIRVEKYANKIKGNNEPDSLYRYFDKELTDIDFSFNKDFDAKAKSKLYKISLIYNSHSKRETYWMINKVFKKHEKEKVLELFDQFNIEQNKRKPIKNN